MDLTVIVLGGYLEADAQPHRDARERLAADVAAGGPVIVIAEGSSDARWLSRLLEVAAPARANRSNSLTSPSFVRRAAPIVSCP